MSFIKIPLTLKQRLSFLSWSIRYLAQTTVEVYDHDTRESWVERVPLSDRVRGFWSNLETAILGYVYALKEEE